jgi:hypothetical protein
MLALLSQVPERVLLLGRLDIVAQRKVIPLQEKRKRPS